MVLEQVSIRSKVPCFALRCATHQVKPTVHRSFGAESMHATIDEIRYEYCVVGCDHLDRCGAELSGA
jgi:hypothetical protein